ncbi:Serine carboxypeptidase, serine active site,Serine carboxypeptidases, histidine active [Cinara cedri]|uniref:Carboxypeptidase n=1 Tax=Cinara cedri TaxID=506608 RepID=A0A5E4MBM3_9HEMI|nr:Serine carboxypeptidase, serine active site,Serine carboxypeptidases, histidine active [Cinara cedri]
MPLDAVVSAFFVVSAAAVVTVNCARMSYGNDGALYLTPMLREGRVDEARAACVVNIPNDTMAVKSCAGFLTVDAERGSNMFFWFFPAKNNTADAPVLLWLQGGPGASSLYSVFNEHGPFRVTRTGRLEPWQYTWTSTHSVLYVDNPVGAGYSFTMDKDGYSDNQTAVGRNLYAAVVQFFELYAEYRNNEFYVAGESYAGKYVPAVSYAIHTNNPGASVKINFKGLAIGNGLIDPTNQMVYSEFLYQHGLIDEGGKQRFEDLENAARSRIAAGNFTGAYHAMVDMMITQPSLYSELTGLPNIYNMVWNNNPIPFEGAQWDKYVQSWPIRGALHVGQRVWSVVDVVYEKLMYDIPRSVSPWLAALLDAGQYRVLLYSGQLDVIVPYRGTVNVARSLQWSGAESFRNATRTIWRVPTTKSGGTHVAGYATTYGPLTVLLVRNAGHMVPYDQPAWAHDLIKRFTSDIPFHLL